MKTFFLAAGVAALAIAAPAAAKPGGNGGGKGGQAAHASHGGGGQKAARGGGGGRAKAVRGGGGQAKAFRGGGGQAKAFRGGGSRQAKAIRGGGGQKARAPMRFAQQHSKAQRVQKAPKAQRRFARVERPGKIDRKVNQQRFDRQVRIAQGNGKAQQKAFERQAKRFEQRRGQMADRIFDRRNDRVARIREANRDINIFRDRDWQDRAIALNARGFVDGCPPGLAKKAMACVPPGQARQLVGQRLDNVSRLVALSALPPTLSYIYPENDDYYYRYGNGYAYRVDRESQLVSALLPLFGLGVGIGQPYPTAYMGSNYYLPSSLQPFYASSPYSDYRYANGYVYEIDPYTGLVEDVDPMLGYGYGYGQMMPASYSAYNVPYQYRPYYQDSSDYYYRYAPGSIYRVDAGTGLIDQVAALLTGGMAIGQPMPMGYNAYNVPLGYRDQYYDTPNDWYRYSDGYIYRVDPTTQLVTAIVAALT